MQIREDFKVDFDGWHKEANSLFKKALPMFILISLVIPFLTIFTYSKIIDSFSSLLVIQNPLMVLIAMIFACSVSFYGMFYLKRIDFNEKCSLSSVMDDLNKTKSYFLEYCKIHSTFIIILSLLSIMSLVANIANPEIPKDDFKTDIITMANSTLLLVYTSFFLLISAAGNYVLGIVYMGYGMVNKEGAKILTLQATNKYPELKDYLLKKNMISFLVYISLFIFEVIIDNTFLNMALKLIALTVSAYLVTIYYLISRDLYGGKPNKQTVKQEDESLNALPSIS